ncbi:hypothetical protein GCM10010303_50100 [Streptomyces purpurascens]|nr:hypothetical protein GCM10010303_50100 [Streptomyces purpurascens]
MAPGEQFGHHLAADGSGGTGDKNLLRLRHATTVGTLAVTFCPRASGFSLEKLGWRGGTSPGRLSWRGGRSHGAGRDAVRAVRGAGSGGMPATAAMLDFCAEHGITADIELLPSARVHEALDRLRRNDVRYRFVLDMSDLD